MGGSFLKIMKLLFEDCEQESAEDRTLPNNSFLIEYKIDGVSHYDIAIASKQVEIFDHYYDKYKKDFVTITQTEGRISPKLWGIESPQTKKKK